MKVLIVEQDDAVRASRVAAFHLAGHRAEGKATCDAALRALRRATFDLFLVDPFREPDWNFSLLALARILNPTCHAVILTGTPLFNRGELFHLTPQAISIIHLPIGNADLLILCEEQAMRNASRHASEADGPPVAMQRMRRVMR